ncbi:error-prone DNA polymerase [Clostridium sp. N3C]|uniref:PHP domain-containing protein n=1 Tax=Clostridium sp. N3C TaxID=1776758 RepID=UPI00092DEE22|nr:PHP domain-containing protein [Clostridium sp. N3C]SCN21683.1 error-prone DNA polymerase [Clostridium sp. N3C]
MNIKADLHLHTTASDGKLSPSELVNLAYKEGLNIIAITDHDTTEGIDDALLAAETLSIKVIPGIELSTQHNGETVHILGYFRDNNYKKEGFQKYLQDMKAHRIYRGKEIIRRLKEYFDISLDYGSLLKEAKGVIARPHIARAIIEAGYNYSWEYIFDKILSSNSPAYVPNKKLSTEDGIKLLKSVNAIVVLAHPVLVKKTPCEELIKLDFHGIEAIYPLNSEYDTNRYINLALNNKKLVTAGSDYHGGDAGDVKHGYIGKINYNEAHLQEFLKFLK